MSLYNKLSPVYSFEHRSGGDNHHDVHLYRKDIKWTYLVSDEKNIWFLISISLGVHFTNILSLVNCHRHINFIMRGKRLVLIKSGQFDLVPRFDQIGPNLTHCVYVCLCRSPRAMGIDVAVGRPQQSCRQHLRVSQRFVTINFCSFDCFNRV